MLVIHTMLSVDTENEAEAIDHARKTAQLSREEDGVLDYRVATDVEDNRLHLVERYEDEAAFERHLDTDHYRSFEAAVLEQVAQTPDITRFEIAAASSPSL